MKNTIEELEKQERAAWDSYKQIKIPYDEAHQYWIKSLTEVSDAKLRELLRIEIIKEIANN